MFSLTGKRAFITGGAGGIGAAVARRFRAAGAEVAIADFQDAGALADSIGARAFFVDVGDEGSLRDALQAAWDAIGPLDIVVNNAGIGDVGTLQEDLDAETLERITRINLWGVQYGLKHAPRLMNDGGSIINTSSLAAQISMAGSAAYSASKAALTSLTQMAAIELGNRGIRVNAVLPGYVETALGSGDEGKTLMETFTALGRMARTEDLVGVYHFLAAPESAFITGQNIVVDGGWSAGPSRQLLERIIGTPHVN
jgi:NAD(P)-dependent dehydrogenase (short-subunit alcohol dehydrogenase family)